MCDIQKDLPSSDVPPGEDILKHDLEQRYTVRIPPVLYVQPAKKHI
jgi:hypothetical protein